MKTRKLTLEKLRTFINEAMDEDGMASGEVAADEAEAKTSAEETDDLNERVLPKRASMRKMNDLRDKLGDTVEYYNAVIDLVKGGVIAPAAVVGGGYKDGKKIAIQWLESGRDDCVAGSGECEVSQVDDISESAQLLRWKKLAGLLNS